VVADSEKRRHRRSLAGTLVLVFGTAVICPPAFANGVDSRAYTCGGLHSLIAAHGFVFISQATFGDFVVANRSYCSDGDVLELRSVATSDNPECLVNYCVSRSVGKTMGNGR
jgi:hypothetical protein